MPRVVIFVGPSLARDEVRNRLSGLCELEICDPAGQGDLAASVVSGRTPHVIALIDGVYEHEPSVWHKEVLWALTKGVWVVGGASMGALRAAELHSFGMIPVGWVAERFISGELVADEEVAVAHLDGDNGWRAVSDALVSIRATITDAELADVVSADEGKVFLSAARALHYTERVWPTILDGASDTVNSAFVERFRRWLVDHRRNIKAEDARAVLERVVEQISDLRPFVPSFTLQSTSQWLAVTPRPADGTDAELRNDVHDELRLNGEWVETLQSSLLRVLASKVFPIRDADSVAAWVDAVTSRVHADDLKGLSLAAIEGLACQQASLHQAWATCGPDAIGSVTDVLRIRGEYGALRSRVGPVFAANAALGSPDGAVDPLLVGIEEHTVLDELQRVLGVTSTTVGEGGDVSIERLHERALMLGFDDVDGARRAVLRRLIEAATVSPASE